MPTPDIIELPSINYVFHCIADRVPRGGAHVYDGSPRARRRHFPVTNLGWLLRHASDVEDFYVTTVPANATVHYDAMLAARLRGGKVYVTEFADRRVLADWLDRPSFRDLTVHWDHVPYIIGRTPLP